MAHNQQKLMSALAGVLAVTMLAGCGQGAAASSPDPKNAIAAVGAPKVTADIRACAGVEAVIGHLASGTARWSPNLAPFDKAISSQIRLQSQNLAKQAPQARSKHLKVVVLSNARAFALMADAMTGKDRNKVKSSIKATKVAYLELKKVCELR